ncbi:TauD/TfdA family dioxygenase [Sphingomonas sp. 8AM]|uniref:TauD/TfdA family dioxygenase n=1 Tax=Sphingomonas sp. 8AM TaxID=2653170 RepID=UPI001359C1CF|nr:TauD/TfdA family dioxygenase [Sphingomonas sp. 8AM]
MSDFKLTTTGIGTISELALLRDIGLTYNACAMTSEIAIDEGSGRSELRMLADLDGYVVLPGIAAGRPTDRVAEELGQVMLLSGGKLVQELTPKATSTPNTYSGLFGLDRFPFHTDLAHWLIPPRYLLLRCIRGYADVPTMILDGRAIASDVGADLMGRALVRPRRPRRGEVRMLRLRQSDGTDDIIRWDIEYLKPASHVGELVFSNFQNRVEEATPTAAVMVDDGDVLIIDNWRMLHARPAIAPNRRDRRLQRVYLRSLA